MRKSSLPSFLGLSPAPSARRQAHDVTATRTRVQQLAALCGAALLFSGCPSSEVTDGGLSPTPLPTLVINEVMAANATTLADSAGEFDDWIEILNTGDTSVELAGMALTDDPLETDKSVFPPSTPAIGPGEFVVVFADKDPDQGALHADIRLSKDGESVLLYDANGRAVSDLSFGAQFDDISFGIPSDSGSPGFLLVPTPGEANSGVRTTFPDGGVVTPDPEDAGPAEPEDAGTPPPAAEDVVINEVLVVNENGIVDEAGEREPWIELFNAGGETVSLRAHGLQDEGPIANRWIFPSTTSIESGGYLVLFADQDPIAGERHADVTVLPAGGAVHLIAPDATVIDTMTFGAQTADVSTARLPNGSGAFAAATPTPGTANAAVGVDGGPPTDAGEQDAGEHDAGEQDAGGDAGDLDAGTDAGEVDAGSADAGNDAG